MPATPSANPDFCRNTTCRMKSMVIALALLTGTDGALDPDAATGIAVIPLSVRLVTPLGLVA